MEFDYTEEAVEQLKKLIEQEKVTLLNTYEDSLKCIKNNQRNYLEEKKIRLEQGKGIRINRKQLLEKWDKQKLAYFQNNTQIKIHPSQSEFLFMLLEKLYLGNIKSMYVDETAPYNKIEAHEFFRQKPISFSNDDISFLEYEYSSKDEYSLYINKHPYLVWMGKSKLIQRDETGKPIWNSEGTDFLYKYSDCHVVVQRFYNGFYWVVSSYEAIDSRLERRHQAIDDMMAMIGQEVGAKTIEQISKELYEYMWLTPLEVQSLLSLATLQYVNRYRDQINDAIGDKEYKPRSSIAQQEFSNPLTLSIQYP
jgi:hypothetical protein